MLPHEVIIITESNVGASNGGERGAGSWQRLCLWLDIMIIAEGICASKVGLRVKSPPGVWVVRRHALRTRTSQWKAYTTQYTLLRIYLQFLQRNHDANVIRFTSNIFSRNIYSSLCFVFFCTVYIVFMALSTAVTITDVIKTCATLHLFAFSVL